MVSLRLSVADRKKVKMVADQLGVAESDVFRFAITQTLDRLAPLHNKNATGEELLGTFLDFGSELADYFEITPQRLERLLTDHAGIAEKIEPKDVEMLTMASTAETNGRAALNENPHGTDSASLRAETMREYFFAKYIRSTDDRPVDS